MSLLPVGKQNNAEAKERLIEEIAEELRSFDAERVGLVKTIVRGLKV